MDWAELITLDLSEYEQPGGKESLVKKLEHAVRHVGEYEVVIKSLLTFASICGNWLWNRVRLGFFYVKNFNISQEEVDRQFAFGREFYALPLEEKLKYHNADDLVKGEYNGYRPAGHRM